MDKPYITDAVFEGKDYTRQRLPRGEYDQCTFINCDFSGGYLDNTHFLECRFEDCNLSNANLKNTMFREVHFWRTKLMGLRFEDCSSFLLSFNFSDCILDLSSFFGMSLKNTQFTACRMAGTEFTETNLQNGGFGQCNLENAHFNGCDLRGADFVTAYNYSIDPEKNQLRNARFSREGVAGLLRKYDIVID
jgi:fluoroquinolone resistance protein